MIFWTMARLFKAMPPCSAVALHRNVLRRPCSPSYVLGIHITAKIFKSGNSLALRLPWIS
jgi:hypothetical protein